MNVPVLVVTHLAAALFGALVCYRLVLRYGRRLDIHLVSEDTMDQTPPSSETESRRSVRLSIVVIIACFLVMVIGGQAWWSHRNDTHNAAVLAHHDACANVWSGQIHGSLQASREATGKLRATDEHWHKRVDAIFQLLIASRTDPDISDAQIDLIVANYQRAKARLFTSYDAAAQTTVDNPYPVLDPNCVLPTKKKAK